MLTTRNQDQERWPSHGSMVAAKLNDEDWQSPDVKTDSTITHSQVKATSGPDYLIHMAWYLKMVQIGLAGLDMSCGDMGK